MKKSVPSCGGKMRFREQRQLFWRRSSTDPRRNDPIRRYVPDILGHLSVVMQSQAFVGRRRGDKVAGSNPTPNRAAHNPRLGDEVDRLRAGKDGVYRVTKKYDLWNSEDHRAPRNHWGHAGSGKLDERLRSKTTPTIQLPRCGEASARISRINFG